MKTILVVLALAGSLILFGCASGQYAGNQHPSQLTSHDVIAMSRAGIDDSLIVSMIGLTGSTFQVKPQDVIALADSGVSNNVIHAMITSTKQAEKADRSSETYGGPYWYSWYYAPWDPWFYGYYPLGLRYGFYTVHPGFGRRWHR